MLRNFKLIKRVAIGFTLVELMITVAIIGMLSLVGGITIISRMRTTRLESTASQIVSDLSYLRSSAILKGCPTRLIVCLDNQCTNAKDVTLTAPDPPGVGVIGAAGVGVARYYGMLRQFHSQDEDRLCHDVSGGVDPNTDDSYDWWDHDRRPQQLSTGVGFTAIYPGVAPANNDGDVNDSNLANAFIFEPEQGNFINLQNLGTTTDGTNIVMQIQTDNCDVSAEEDCLGAFITVDPGGDIGWQRCVAGQGSRSDPSDNCF